GTSLYGLLNACLYALWYGGKAMSAGELGCYASHYSLWQKCIQLDEPIVILEDDICLKPHFFERLDFLQAQGTRLGYVRFMHLHNHCKIPTAYPNISEIDYLTEGIGTQGYYLTPKVARKFIKASQKWVMPVDWVLDNHYLHGVKNLVIEPHIIEKNEGMQDSNITRFGNRKPPILLQLCAKIHRLYVRFYLKIYAYTNKHP
ncbi:glycosyltransferase family 25 protein, partial [Helicobacter bizzozeronii]|uniref:glycosyltransferase family 25 protein n=1 Tax=Helicobacter bizzozeronii TaxID=56877 RepID=UPI000CEF1BEE